MVEPPDAGDRIFTPAEANAALAELRPLVEQMVEAKRSLDEAEERRDSALRSISGNGGGIPPEKLAELHAGVELCTGALAAAVEAVRARGVLVKDLDTGLVDFPAVLSGEPALLCWRLGEDEVAWWHRYDDGFAGRRPL